MSAGRDRESVGGWMRGDSRAAPLTPLRLLRGGGDVAEMRGDVRDATAAGVGQGRKVGGHMQRCKAWHASPCPVERRRVLRAWRGSSLVHAGRLDVELRGYGSTTRVCSRRVALYWQGRENKGTCRGGLMTVFCQSGVCALRWAGEAEGRPPRSRQFFCHNSQAKFSQGAGFSQGTE